MPTSENLRFGGGLSGTALHPAVTVMLIIAILLILLLPRKYVIVPFLLAIFLTPFGQQLYVGGVHLFVPRILILFAWVRIGLTSKSFQSGIASGGFSSVDKVFICWAIFRATATYLEFLQAGALINQCAFLWDTVGGFFLLRFLIRAEEDILRLQGDVTDAVTLRITLKYGPEREKVITGLRRISRPGLRVYTSKTEIPRVLGGLGLVIMSTSKGIMSGKRAKREGFGGEVLAYVW